MATVKVLIDGVGEWKKGEIVVDAPPGLVEHAERGTRNAATGELIAELIKDAAASKTETGEMKVLKAKAKELKIDGYGKMSVDELNIAIGAAEKEFADAAELKDLHVKAAELGIADSETLVRDELISAIAAAEAANGGGNGGE